MRQWRNRGALIYNTKKNFDSKRRDSSKQRSDRSARARGRSTFAGLHEARELLSKKQRIIFYIRKPWKGRARARGRERATEPESRELKKNLVLRRPTKKSTLGPPPNNINRFVPQSILARRPGRSRKRTCSSCIEGQT